MDNQKRGQWAGNIGFILAAAGSAVGLGNLVKFPYLAAKHGGGAFLLIYLLIVVLIGFPVMLAELTIGRKTNKNEIGAFRQLNKKFTWVGALGILTGFLINCYYCVIGGWTIKYLITYVTGANFGGDTDAFFGNFISSGLQPVLFALVFFVATGFIVWKGVAGGIEKASKFMMPALAILLVIIAIRSCTLPGAIEGIKYYLIPDFSKITGGTFIAALAQAFFSLSLGMGIMVTYGSYLSNKENLAKNALIVPAFDTIIAMTAGFAVLPAMFATGYEPAASTVGSLFVIMPGVFDKLPLPFVFGSLFFILVIFAALTSSISLMEGTVAYVSEEWKLGRTKAVLLVGAVETVLGILASLSLGGNINWMNWLPTVQAGGIKMMSFFDFLSENPDKLFMPIGAMMVCIFVGWFWGLDKAEEHIESEGNKFILKGYWRFAVKWIAPIAIFIIFLSGIGVINF